MAVSRDISGVRAVQSIRKAFTGQGVRLDAFDALGALGDNLNGGYAMGLDEINRAPLSPRNGGNGPS
jgi:hypothetical protein